MDKILEMSREINYSSLVYKFKGPTSPICFIQYGGPMYTYDQLKDGVKTLQQPEEEQKGFKSELGQIKSRDPQTKSSTQLDTIKNV